MNLGDLPMGFGMTLAQNEKALECYMNMSGSQRLDVLNRTNGIKSKKDMRKFVDGLAQLDF
ncbi:MAG: hypothetical protein R3Y27_01255 [Clostridia bacterium]